MPATIDFHADSDVTALTLANLTSLEDDRHCGTLYRTYRAELLLVSCQVILRLLPLVVEQESPRSVGKIMAFVWDSVKHYFVKDAILSAQQLRRLSEHKYSAQDRSILDELFMHKFWSWLVLKYPLWLAPNVITLVGLLLNVAATVILGYYSSDAKQDVGGIVLI